MSIRIINNYLVCISILLINKIALAAILNAPLNEEKNSNGVERVIFLNKYVATNPSATTKTMVYTSLDNGFNWGSGTEIKGFTGLMKVATCNGNNNQSCIAIESMPYYKDGSNLYFIAYTKHDVGSEWKRHIFAKAKGPYAAINAVTCDSQSGKYCVAVGALANHYGDYTSTIYTSSDGGDSWISHDLERFGTLGVNLKSVTCNGYNGQYCTAVGEHSGSPGGVSTFVAYNSSDGGLNWTPQIIEKRPREGMIYSITCNNNGNNCMTVAHDNVSNLDQLIYKTTNAGVSWSSYIPSQKMRMLFTDVTCGQDNKNCVAVGGAGPKTALSCDYLSKLRWRRKLDGLSSRHHDIL